MKFQSRNEFAKSLDSAAREFLRSSGVDSNEKYRIRVEECPLHGIDCALVIYGMLCDHVIWRWAEPKRIAAATMQSMLPRRTESAGPGAASGGSTMRTP
jgi:hypothetical protein